MRYQSGYSEITSLVAALSMPQALFFLPKNTFFLNYKLCWCGQHAAGAFFSAKKHLF